MVGNPDLADEFFLKCISYWKDLHASKREGPGFGSLWSLFRVCPGALAPPTHTRGCVEDDDEEGCVCYYVWVPTTLWP